MIPGSTSKLSESTVPSAPGGVITVKSDITKLTSANPISRIIPNFGGGFGGFTILVATNGAVTVNAGSTSGSILVGGTVPANGAMILIYVRSLDRWVIA